MVSRRRLAALTGLIAGVGALSIAGIAAAEPIGPQQRVSEQGPLFLTTYAASNGVVGFSTQRNLYLAAWSGDLTVGEKEIFVRPVGADGAPIGGAARVSFMGAGNPPAADQDAVLPDIAYNPTADEFLVVWQGNDGATGGLAPLKDEIYGRRVSPNGAPIGTQFRISFSGTDLDGNYEASDPAVAYNPELNEYVVVWSADTPETNDGSVDIFARRVSAAGVVNPGTFRIGNPGDSSLFDAFSPDVAFDPKSGDFVAVWYADSGTDEEYEIYGQRFTSTLQAVGADDFRISTMGANGVTTNFAFTPSIAFNPVADRYLVTWHGNDATEFEIHGQLLSATGTEVGTDDFRISDMGPDGSTAFAAFTSNVVASTRAGEFLVTWYGDDDTAPLVDNENEIFGQRLSGQGAALGTNDFRISQMGPNGSTVFTANTPYGAYNANANEYLATWQGDDNVASVDNEFEIWDRRVEAGAATEGLPANCKPVAPGRRPGASRGTVKLTRGQLLTNQRIGQAAIRRANAIERWLNQGIRARDICGNGLDADDLAAQILKTTGPFRAQGPQADPRPLNVAKPGRRSGRVQLSSRQLATDQKIFQAAVRRSNALLARVRRLTGGDVVNASITFGQLPQDLVITSSTPTTPPPARSRTVVGRGSGGKGQVRLTLRQLKTNQAIAAAAVRRTNTLATLLAKGLTDSNFRDGSITKVDLAPGVSP
jgi:hypothetical protein